MKKLLFIFLLFLCCAHPNQIEDPKKEYVIISDPNSFLTIKGTISNPSGKTYVSITRPQSIPSFDGTKSNILSQTTTNTSSFSLPKTDCSDCYITAHTESNHKIISFTSQPLSNFNGTLTLSFKNNCSSNNKNSN